MNNVTPLDTPPPKYWNRFLDSILELLSMTYMDFEFKGIVEDINVPVDNPQDNKGGVSLKTLD